MTHQLATNAVKYGAHSDPDGYIEVGWSVGTTDGKKVFAFEWKLIDRPLVIAPIQQSFDTKLIRAGVA